MGRGFIYMLISSLVWLISGFLVNSITGRWLGPASYGTFGIIYAFITTSYLVLGGGVKRAVTKFIAAEPERAADIRVAGLRVQMIICVIIVMALFIISGPMSQWLHDENLKVFIRYSAAVVPVAGILYVYIGYFDGCKQFDRTAVITVSHSISKVVFVFLLLYFGYEIFGAITGLLIGLGCPLLLAILLGRHARGTRSFEQKKIIQFSLPVLSFFLCVSVLTYLDLFFVKALLDDPVKTGYYTSAQTISRLISFAMFPFGIVLLPFISSAIAKNDLVKVRRYIGESLRYVLIILVPTCMMLSATAKQVLMFVYGSEYVSGAMSLRILFLGMSCWGITHAMVSIIQGYGQPGKPALIFAVMIPVDIILIQISIRFYGMEGAAIATTCTFIMGMVLAGMVIYKKYSVLVNIRTILHTLIASVIACSQFLFLTPSGFLLFACYLLAFCIYFAVLWGLGEIKRADMVFLGDAVNIRRFR